MMHSGGSSVSIEMKSRERHACSPMKGWASRMASSVLEGPLGDVRWFAMQWSSLVKVRREARPLRPNAQISRMISGHSARNKSLCSEASARVRLLSRPRRERSRPHAEGRSEHLTLVHRGSLKIPTISSATRAPTGSRDSCKALRVSLIRPRWSSSATRRRPRSSGGNSRVRASTGISCSSLWKGLSQGVEKANSHHCGEMPQCPR